MQVLAWTQQTYQRFDLSRRLWEHQVTALRDGVDTPHDPALSEGVDTPKVTALSAGVDAPEATCRDAGSCLLATAFASRK